MSIREKLEQDQKAAMKSGDALRVSVIRLARSEIRNSEIAKRRSLTDEEIVEVLNRESKRRREAVEFYEKAGRTDLVDKETAEMRILSEYLPQQMSEAEITGIAQEVIAELEATSKSDKGKVMSAVMQRVRGRADGRLVNQTVDRLLDNSSAQA